MATTLPLLLSPEWLAEHLEDDALLLVDLSSASTYIQLHIPGAVHLDYAALTLAQPPVGGLMPEADQLAFVLAAIGYAPTRHVVAYDDEGGGKAARLLFTLDALGLPAGSLLDGGLHAWANEGHPLERQSPTPRPSRVRVAYLEPNPVIADADYILARLAEGDAQLLDVRSPDEYHDRTRYARRGGHIPGAVNLEWTEAMDRERNLRLLPQALLRERLDALGLDPAREVITYCQTHHRSAYGWFLLKLLGYAARGYPGSWSDWGNRHDTPVES